MAKKTIKNPVKDLKRKPKKISKPKVLRIQDFFTDPQLLGLVISGIKTKEEGVKLAQKIRELHFKLRGEVATNQYQRGYQDGQNSIKDSLRSLIGAAAEDHSHNIS